MTTFAKEHPNEFHVLRESISNTHVEFSAPPDTDKKDSAFVLATVLVLLLSITLFAARIGGRVTEEKSSRIVEILLSSLNPRELLIGKIFGNLFLGISVITLLLFPHSSTSGKLHYGMVSMCL